MMRVFLVIRFVANTPQPWIPDRRFSIIRIKNTMAHTFEERPMRLHVTLAFVSVAIAMAFAQSSKQIVTTGGNPNLPFSPAVKAGGLIYVAGTLGTDASGAVAKGDIKAQTRQTLDNIGATLKAAGSSMANATSVLIYLRNAADFTAMNEVYATYWPKDPPARATVVVPQPLAN